MLVGRGGIWAAPREREAQRGRQLDFVGQHGADLLFVGNGARAGVAEFLRHDGGRSGAPLLRAMLALLSSTSTRPSSVITRRPAFLSAVMWLRPQPRMRANSDCRTAFVIAPSSSLRPTLRVLAVEFFTRDAPCNAVKIETPLIVRHANKDHHRLNSAAPCAEVEALINAR